jgi:hypothetical protein
MGGSLRQDRKGLVRRLLLCVRHMRNHHSHLLTASVGVLRRRAEGVFLEVGNMGNRHSYLPPASVGVLRRHPEGVALGPLLSVGNMGGHHRFLVAAAAPAGLPWRQP